MKRWALSLLALAALFLAGCGSEHERGKNSKGDRPKRGDKASQLGRPAPGASM
jgi:hypothetical protein